MQGEFELGKVSARKATQVLVNPTRPVGEVGLDPLARSREVKAAVAFGNLGCQVHQPIGVPLDRVLGVANCHKPLRAFARRTQTPHQTQGIPTETLPTTALGARSINTRSPTGPHRTINGRTVRSRSQKGRITQEFTSLPEIVN